YLFLSDHPPTTHIYSLSLHDALPILPGDFYSYHNNFISLQKKVSGYAVSPDETFIALEAHGDIFIVRNDKDNPRTNHLIRHAWRSEEHTSELQSRENLVCRLLLEKKK